MENLRKAFLQLAKDEGNKAACRELQALQSALETILDFGNGEERDAASRLLHVVNVTLHELA